MRKGVPSAYVASCIGILTIVTPHSVHAQAPPSVTDTVVDTVWEISPDVEVRVLAPGVWLHTSYYTYPGNVRVPSNGLIVQDGDSLLIVDSAWGELLTQRLVDSIEARYEQHVSAVIITHSHYDRIAGTTVFQHRGAQVLAHPLTRRLANEQGLPLPDTLSGVAEPGTATRFGAVEIFYGGPGHSVDNVMVWIPDAGVLFGGCAVRAATATSLGNVAHADLTRWPEAVRRAQERYGAARIVVPGHGDPGDAGLFAHTLSLFSR